MSSRAVLWALLVVAIGFCGAGAPPAWAEGSDPAALAAALKDTTTTLPDGLKAGEREGNPISAKFEIEDGKLQLSVYTLKGDDFAEVVVDPKTGAVAKSEKITESDDLKEATAQKARWRRRRCHCSPLPMRRQRPMQACGRLVFTRSCRTAIQWRR